MSDTALQIQSLLREDQVLEVRLAEVPVPTPGPDEVLVRVEAAPINPSDLGLLFGTADMSTARATGTAERPVIEADGTVSNHTVTVKAPVLGLVPVPALLIETVDVDFSMEINSVVAEKTSSEKEGDVEAEAGGGIGLWHASVKAHGRVATQRENTRSTDKTAKYDVRVHAAQQPPTEGMSKLMDLLASTVEPMKIEPRSGD